MSDGPHRSLNMRRGWKQLAEHADNSAFSVEEVGDTLQEALRQDWLKEVSKGFCQRIQNILNESQGSLPFFSKQKIEQLEFLRGEAAGYPLRSVLLDCTIQAVAEGYSGEEAFEKAICDALAKRKTSGGRQVEEHYWRKSTQGRAARVRQRIEESNTPPDMARFARHLTGPDKAERLHPPVKKTDIDDGVPLS